MAWAVIAVAAAIWCSEAAAQTIYKCVGKDGKTSYSNAPCPGAKAISDAGGGGIDLKNLTQLQANLVADCSDVLHSASDPAWRRDERLVAGFNKYCPPFGFQPFGPQTLQANVDYARRLIESARQYIADVPNYPRTYNGHSRSPPEFSDAEQAMRDRPSKSPGLDASLLPRVPAGLWKVKSVTNGQPAEHELCGNPVGQFHKLLQDAPELAKLGCSVRLTSTGPRAVRLVMDCAADRYENGRTIYKGRSEGTLVSPSPTVVRTSMRSAQGQVGTSEASRVGDC